MIRLFLYDSTWFNVDNDTDAQNLINNGAVEYTSDQIRGVEGNETWVSNDTMFQDENGEWYYENINENTDLDVLRENKIVELENYRNYLRNTETASYDNDSFLIRQEDQNNMNTYYSKAIAIKMGVVPSNTFVIMSATNTSHTFTADQIIELFNAMCVKVEEIYQRHWYAQNVLLANALTADEINAVQIPLSL